MPRQYKLRLGDGTVLAVDQQALRTWLLDDKAMVQPAGSRGWRPLKLLLAERGAPAAITTAQSPESTSGARAIDDAGSPVISPPAPLGDSPSPPRVTSAEARPIVPLQPQEEGEDKDEALGCAVTTPSLPGVETTPPPGPTLVDEIAVIPLKRPDESEDQESAIAADAPLAMGPLVDANAPAPDDALPIIPLKPLKEDAEDVLEELELVEEAVVVEESPLKSLEGILVVLVEAAAAWLHVVSTMVSRFIERASASRPASSDAPVVLWTAAEDRRARLKHDSAGFVTTVQRGVKRLVLMGALVAGAILAAVIWRTWLPEELAVALFTKVDEPARPPAPSAPAAASPKPVQPNLSKEMQAAAEQLPHLAADTIRLVFISEFGSPDHPEMFRRAHAAARRGASALTEQEAQELTMLQGVVLAALRPKERARVRAYDRIRAGRDLLSAEDGKVLLLYARGARALHSRRRERLQALLGKAIAAALAPTAAAPALRSAAKPF